MKDSNIRARISQLHKTEAQWSLIPNFVPLHGELIIFDPDEYHVQVRLKIGDGSTLLRDLPFFIDSTIDTFIVNNFDKVIDAGRITAYKK